METKTGETGRALNLTNFYTDRPCQLLQMAQFYAEHCNGVNLVLSLLTCSGTVSLETGVLLYRTSR